MKVVLLDGRRLHGTPLAIVQAMRERAVFCEAPDLAGYVAFVVDKTERFHGLVLRPVGATDGELAASLLAELLRVGLASLPN